MFRKNKLLVIITLFVINSIHFNFAEAHDIHISELRIIHDDSIIHLELTMNAFELGFLGEIDISNNGVIDWNQFSENKDIVIQKLRESLMVELNGKLLTTDKTGLTVDDTHHLIFREHFRLTESEYTGTLKITSKLREFTSRSHITRVTFDIPEKQQNAQLEGHRNSVEFDLVQNQSSPAEASFQEEINPTGNILRYAVFAMFISLIALGVYFKFDAKSKK